MAIGLDQGGLAALRPRGRLIRRDRPPAIRLRAPARRPMVIEFIGVSGSGKSTLCAAIAAELRQDGFTIVTGDDYRRWRRQPLHRKVGAVVLNGVRTWLFVLYVFAFLHRCASLRGRRLLSMGYHLTCMHVWLAQAVARTPSLPVLLDGFACPRLTNWLRYRPATDLAESQLRRTLGLFYPRCDVHWFFKTVPVEVALARLTARPVHAKRAPKGIERSSLDRRSSALGRQMELYQSICNAMRSRYGDHVSYVDGAKPIPEQVCLVKEVILGLFEAETAAASSLKERVSA
jgi:thymidylate kinase